LSYVTEEIATFAAWDSMCHDYELGVLEMPRLERARYDELLCRAQTTTSINPHAVLTASSPTIESGDGADELEASLEDVLTGVSCALVLDFQPM
jgi:hypothetical protein